MNDRDSRGRLRKRANLYVVSCPDHRSEPMSRGDAEEALALIQRFGACKQEHRIVPLRGVTPLGDDGSTDNDTKEKKR